MTETAPLPAPAPAEELQDIIQTLVELARDAIHQRDIQSELAEDWSVVACESAIRVGIRDARIEVLRDALLEALKLALDRILDIKAYERLHALAMAVE